jgi:hypothetical protein
VTGPRGEHGMSGRNPEEMGAMTLSRGLSRSGP